MFSLKTTFYLILLFITLQISIAQSIYSNIFIQGTKSHLTEHFDLRDKPSYDYAVGFNYIFGYRHKISKKYNLNLYCQYSSYSPSTGFSMLRNPNTSSINYTVSIISGTYIDIGLQKKINISVKKLFLNLSLGLRRAKIKRTWPFDSIKWTFGNIKYYANEGNYYLPQLEIGLDFKIRKRWHFTIMKMYTFGLYGKFQETQFDWTFTSDKYPTTKSYSNGTSHQLHIGVQFDFFDMDKQP